MSQNETKTDSIQCDAAGVRASRPMVAQALSLLLGLGLVAGCGDDGGGPTFPDDGGVDAAVDASDTTDESSSTEAPTSTTEDTTTETTEPGSTDPETSDVTSTEADSGAGATSTDTAQSSVTNSTQSTDTGATSSNGTPGTDSSETTITSDDSSTDSSAPDSTDASSDDAGADSGTDVTLDLDGGADATDASATDSTESSEDASSDDASADIDATDSSDPDASDTESSDTESSDTDTTSTTDIPDASDTSSPDLDASDSGGPTLLTGTGPVLPDPAVDFALSGSPFADGAPGDGIDDAVFTATINAPISKLVLVNVDADGEPYFVDTGGGGGYYSYWTSSNPIPSGLFPVAVNNTDYNIHTLFSGTEDPFYVPHLGSSNEVSLDLYVSFPENPQRTPYYRLYVYGLDEELTQIVDFEPPGDAG